MVSAAPRPSDRTRGPRGRLSGAGDGGRGGDGVGHGVVDEELKGFGGGLSGSQREGKEEVSDRTVKWGMTEVRLSE